MFVTLKKVYDRIVVNKYRLSLLLGAMTSNLIAIYIYSSYDERIQRKQSAHYRKRRAITAKVTLTSARCDTVIHIRRWRR